MKMNRWMYLPSFVLLAVMIYHGFAWAIPTMGPAGAVWVGWLFLILAINLYNLLFWERIKARALRARDRAREELDQETGKEPRP